MNDISHTLVAGSTELLVHALPVEKGRVRSRRILSAPGVRLVRISLDAGEALREHVATSPILIQGLAGHAMVEVGGERIDLPAGAVVYVTAHLPHAVEALTETHLMLTIMDQQEQLPRDVAVTLPRRRTSTRKTANAVPPKASMRSNLVLASSGADSAAVDGITRHHAELSGALAALSAHVLGTAGSDDTTAGTDARTALLDWCRAGLLPYLESEAAALHPSLQETADGVLLATLLEAELERILATVEEMEARGPELAPQVIALRVTVGRYLSTEAEQLLPILAASPQHSLAELWAQVEPAVPVPAVAEFCECGIVEPTGFPELDVTAVPHAIRHATVFGALDAVGPGGGLVLVAPHDPLPLLAQIEQRSPRLFDVSYLQRGPDAWRLRFVRARALTPA